MFPSWLKTVLIVVGVVAVIGFVVFLWLLVAGADMKNRRDNQSRIEDKEKLQDNFQINNDKRNKP